MKSFSKPFSATSPGKAAARSTARHDAGGRHAAWLRAQDAKRRKQSAPRNPHVPYASTGKPAVTPVKLPPELLKKLAKARPTPTVPASSGWGYDDVIDVLGTILGLLFNLAVCAVVLWVIFVFITLLGSPH